MRCKNDLHDKAEKGPCKPCHKIGNARRRTLKPLSPQEKALNTRAYMLLAGATNEVLVVVGKTPQGREHARISTILKAALGQIWALQTEMARVKEIQQMGREGFEFEPAKIRTTRNIPLVRPLRKDGRIR